MNLQQHLLRGSFVTVTVDFAAGYSFMKAKGICYFIGDTVRNSSVDVLNALHHLQFNYR